MTFGLGWRDEEVATPQLIAVEAMLEAKTNRITVLVAEIRDLKALITKQKAIITRLEGAGKKGAKDEK